MITDDGFVYSRLDNLASEIRLLNIHPGEVHDDVVITFESFQLKDDEDAETDFEAVSYRWGPPDGQHQIRLDGKYFTVTSSQDRMLRDLRYPNESRRLWIDALCINQKDLPERNGQVRLMRRIYSSARQVCVWLDQSIEEDSCVFRKFLTFDESCKPEQLLEEDEFFWDPICSVLTLEYFRRLWVQQELSNATQVHVQCRRRVLPATCIMHFIEAWEHVYMDNFYDGDRKDGLTRAPQSLLRRAIEGSHSTISVLSAPAFLHILAAADDLKYSDQHDVVYGLMFLDRNWNEDDLVVDYSMTVEEVLTATMVSYLKVYGSLDFLEYCNYSFHDHENLEHYLPSWAPDWRRRMHANSPKSSHRRLKADADHSSIAHVSGNLLHINGVRISSVSYFNRELMDGAETANGYPVLPGTFEYKRMFRMVSDILDHATSPADNIDKLSHLIYLWVYRSKSETEEELAETLEDQAIDFQVLSDQVEEGAFSTIQPTLSVFLGALTRLVKTEETKWASHVVEMMKGMVFAALFGLFPFVNTAGVIGLAPLATQAGDEVWLIPTCVNPIILRPLDGTYFVIGIAFIGAEFSWESLGATYMYFIEGEEVAGYTVEAICLQ